MKLVNTKDCVLSLCDIDFLPGISVDIDDSLKGQKHIAEHIKLGDLREATAEDKAKPDPKKGNKAK